MSLSPNEKYPGATEADPNYKDSKFKDNNPSTTNNGSPLKALDRNEQLALQEAMMNAAGFDYNGVVDTPQNSQMFNAYKAALSNGANLLSNHNFIIASPDDSQPAPSATPTSYPPGYEIFSGVFANETTGILNLTYIDGRVSFSGGDFYMPVPNTGALENITEFVASVADFDGKPRTRGVSYALVGDEYRVTVGVDALEDVAANPTPLGSVKFEQGIAPTGHEIQRPSSFKVFPSLFIDGTYTDTSIVGVVVGDYVAVCDYAPGNNSGTLFFKAVKAGTGVADNFKYIDVPLLNIQLEANLSLPVNAKAAGFAEINTATQNSTSMQTAIDYGKGVLIPDSGIYNCNRIELKSNSTVIALNRPTINFEADGFRGNLVSNATISGLKLTVSGSSVLQYEISGCTYMNVLNCEFVGGIGNLYVSETDVQGTSDISKGCKFITIDNCHFEDTEVWPIYLRSDGDRANGTMIKENRTEHVNISNVSFKNITSTAINCSENDESSPVVPFDTATHNVNINNVVIDTAANGFHLERCADFNISNVTIKNIINVPGTNPSDPYANNAALISTTKNITINNFKADSGEIGLYTFLPEQFDNFSISDFTCASIVYNTTNFDDSTKKAFSNLTFEDGVTQGSMFFDNPGATYTGHWASNVKYVRCRSLQTSQFDIFNCPRGIGITIDDCPLTSKTIIHSEGRLTINDCEFYGDYTQHNWTSNGGNGVVDTPSLLEFTGNVGFDVGQAGESKVFDISGFSLARVSGNHIKSKIVTNVMTFDDIHVLNINDKNIFAGMSGSGFVSTNTGIVT